MDGIADWRGRPAPVWTVVLFSVAATLLCTIAIAFGRLPAVQLRTHVVIGLGAAAVAAALWAVGPRVPAVALHLVRLVGIGAITVLVAQARTGEGAVSIALGFTWLAVHAAIFSPRPVARAYAGLGLVGSAVGLAVSVPALTGALAWILLGSTTVIASESLAVLFRRVHALSLSDRLTGLLNRSGFDDAVARERASARRTGTSVVLVVVDLDGFKAINDEHGHHAGDRLLAALAHEWRTHLRPRDVVGRLGGDEFALALPDTSPEEAGRLLARLRATTPIGFSCGAVGLDPDEPLHDALVRADQAMYHDKRGRAAAQLDLGLEQLDPLP